MKQPRQQLNNLGFHYVYIYTGGLFEWSLLQEVYVKDNFPTNLNVVIYYTFLHIITLFTWMNFLYMIEIYFSFGIIVKCNYIKTQEDLCGIKSSKFSTALFLLCFLYFIIRIYCLVFLYILSCILVYFFLV